MPFHSVIQKALADEHRSLPLVAFELPNGKRAVLRPPTPADKDELFEVIDRNRERLSEWLPWPGFVKQPDDELFWITNARQGLAALGKVLEKRDIEKDLGEKPHDGQVQENSDLLVADGKGASRNDANGKITTNKKDAPPEPTMEMVLLVEGVAGLWHIAGSAGLVDIDFDKRIAFVGYWLDERFCGQKITQEAVRELTAVAFERLGMEHIDITAARGNAASQGVPTALARKHVLDFQRLDSVHDGEMLKGVFHHLLPFVATNKSVEKPKCSAREAHEDWRIWRRLNGDKPLPPEAGIAEP
eukprot:TRINITY_DN88838_c0_g1_i1.p1 TRINITY_DN88838_c0_g1~~TRINITY_DN88838_c0_g1_i1.p1  ORF type:complete len:316 (-),score=36.15 TRINITY_DN88838_c0_g1_i1:416-1318(-)